MLRFLEHLVRRWSLSILSLCVYTVLIQCALVLDPAPTSHTPRVNDFSFVSAIPSPRASQLPPQALQELMTWGSIEATPVTLRSSSLDSDGSVGPFRIEDTSKREELAFKMARKAKRSLAQSASGGKGLATDARTRGGSTSLRRSAMESSIRGTPGSSRGGGASTPRTGDHLSPAARSLLGKTKPGMALEMGLKRSEGHLKYEEEVEERKRIERAKKRAREVESRDRLKRERWTVRTLSCSGSNESKETDQMCLCLYSRVLRFPWDSIRILKNKDSYPSTRR